MLCSLNAEINPHPCLPYHHHPMQAHAVPLRWSWGAAALPCCFEVGWDLLGEVERGECMRGACTSMTFIRMPPPPHYPGA